MSFPAWKLLERQKIVLRATPEPLRLRYHLEFFPYIFVLELFTTGFILGIRSNLIF